MSPILLETWLYFLPAKEKSSTNVYLFIKEYLATTLNLLFTPC